MEIHQPQTHLFLWHGQALYLGQGRDSSMHQHHALQIGISFEHPFLLRYHSQASYSPVPCFLVRPNTPHQILSASRHALFLWIEAESDLARSLLALESATGFLSEEQIAAVQTAMPFLRELSASAVTCEHAMRVVREIFSVFLPRVHFSSSIEERLSLALQLLKQQVYEEETRFSPQHIAALLHLSESRLRHVFGGQFGLSMQHYLLWQRLLAAIERTTHGLSLTQAAHDAGFADAAHFTRTFRAMFGITPSSVLKNSHDIQVIGCQC
jgi:AraC-like DNA-binding protein